MTKHYTKTKIITVLLYTYHTDILNRNRFSNAQSVCYRLLCLKLVVATCEPSGQLKTDGTELQCHIAVNSAGSVPIFRKGLALPGSRKC